MKNLLLIAALSLSVSSAMAATPNNTASNGFDQAADSIGVSSQTYNTHLSASSTKTAPNDAIDDVIQNDTSPDPVNLDGSSNSSS